jgi:hypothetical protein
MVMMMTVLMVVVVVVVVVVVAVVVVAVAVTDFASMIVVAIVAVDIMPSYSYTICTHAANTYLFLCTRRQLPSRILATEPTAGLIEVVADSVPLKVITKKCAATPAFARQLARDHDHCNWRSRTFAP